MSQELAKAKINLTLEVVGKRGDGYHELNSLVAFASVGDFLSFKKNKTTSLSLSGEFAQGLDGENLILKAVRYMTERFPDVISGAFSLEKLLPVASGIGGGSADAAAAIRLLSQQFPDGLSRLDYSDIARELGADIPVCLQQQAVLMTGIGETLTAVNSMPELFSVLVNPGVPVSTREIFKRLNAPLIQGDNGSQVPIDISSQDKLLGYMTEHGNDLQEIAEGIEPVIATVLSCLRKQEGNLFARMSGSGATCFGIYQTYEAAEKAASFIRSEHPQWWARDCMIG